MDEYLLLSDSVRPALVYLDETSRSSRHRQRQADGCARAGQPAQLQTKDGKDELPGLPLTARLVLARQNPPRRYRNDCGLAEVQDDSDRATRLFGSLHAICENLGSLLEAVLSMKR